jgi:hypothetical protein
MQLLSRLYFNAVFGALGGLLGWMLFGVFGDKNPTGDTAFLFLTREHLNMLLGGAIVGGVIGYFVVSVEAIRDKALMKFCRLGTYGVLLGAVGGALGMLLGDLINAGLLRIADNFFMRVLSRGLGWSILGVFIGMAEGIAARSLGKFSYGTLGGAIGGFVGGMLFMVFYSLAIRPDPETGQASTSHFWSGMGLMIMGACIGSLSALVQAVFQPACVRILRGWQEGREYPLEKPASLLGRDEHADIALFRDMKIEKKHCFIKRMGERYVLFNNGAPADQTLVNERAVADTCELFEGDKIQLGNVLMRFHMRVATNRPKAPRPLPYQSAPAGSSSDPRNQKK